MSPAGRRRRILPAPRQEMPKSAIRTAREAHPKVDLALGQPSWDLPQEARAALAAIERVPYPSHRGSEALRRAILEKETEVGRRGPDISRILVTTGAMGALYALTRAYLTTGDAALVPNPGFPAYAQLTEWTGAKAFPYRLSQENGFRLDPNAIQMALEEHPETRMVFLNHPSNPTGAGAAPEDLQRTVDLCARHGALVISDEVYRHLHPEDVDTPPSVLTLMPDARNVVVVSSVSKSWGAPGLRLGWLIANPAVVDACKAIHAWTMTSIAEPSQRAAIALLENSDTILPRSRTELTRRWTTLTEALCEVQDKPERPDGGFYHWFRLPWTGQADPPAFCHKMLQLTGVAIAPGIAFGQEGAPWARLCFGASPEDLTVGIRRLIAAGAIVPNAPDDRSS